MSKIKYIIIISILLGLYILRSEYSDHNDFKVGDFVEGFLYAVEANDYDYLKEITSDTVYNQIIEIQEYKIIAIGELNIAMSSKDLIELEITVEKPIKHFDNKSSYIFESITIRKIDEKWKITRFQHGS